jgi:hypothetical protein
VRPTTSSDTRAQLLQPRSCTAAISFWKIRGEKT